MEFLIIGIAVALNIIFIKMKFDRKRIEDGIFDTILLVVITMVFGGSYAGLVVGTIASMFISLYLFANPPTFFSGSNGFFAEFKRRAQRKSR